MLSNQMPKKIIASLNVSIVASVCVLLLLTISGCSVRPLSGQPESADFVYRSELADPQAKALFAFSEYRLLAAQSQWQEAVAALERAVGFDPDNPYLQMTLAKALLHRDDIERAIDILESLLLQSPNNFEAHELLGDLLGYRDRQEEAVDHYRQALQLDPDQEMVQMRLSMALSRLGQNEEATQVLLKLVEQHPESPLARLALARNYVTNGQQELGKQTYQKILELFPEQQQAILEYGKLLEGQGLFAEAYQLYRDSIKKNPRFAAVRQQLALLYLKQQRVREALEQFLAIRQQFPENLEVLGKIGLIYLDLSEWTQAEEVFRQLRDQSPDDDRNRYYLGMSLIGQGLRNEAIEVMAEIRESAPIFTEAVLQLSYLYQQTGQVNLAVSALHKLLDLDFRQPEIYYYLASFLDDQGRGEEAAKVIEEGLEQFPQDVTLRYQQGLLFEKLGDRSQALKAMQQVLELKPDHPDALNFIAYHQAEIGDQLELALTRVQQALAVKKAGYIIDTLGWIYFKMGRFQESLAQLEEAVRQYPEDPVILEHLADVYRALGWSEKAAETYRKVLQFNPQATGVSGKLNGLPKPAMP